jgi:HEAT repeat protein
MPHLSYVEARQPSSPVLPALTNALTDSSFMVRFAATNAIEKITSEASTNAPAP